MKKYIVRGDFHPTSATGGTEGTSLDISAGAQSVTLIPSSHVIDYTKVGTESTSITFTTQTFNISGTVYYEFLVGASSKINSETTTYTLVDSDEPGPTDAPIQVTVKLRQGSAGGTLLAQDMVTIHAVQDGQDTVTGLLTNEAHTASADSSGSVSSFSGAGGTFKVYYGNTDITTNAKTAFSVASESGVDVSINSTTGVYTVNSMSASTGTATFSCEVEGSLVGGVDNTNDVTITKTYSIAKSQAGATGSTGQANAIVYAYQRSSSALSSNPGAVTVSLTGNTSGTITTGSLQNGWSKTIPSGNDPLYVVAATAAGNGSTDTIAANEWSTPVILAQGQDGASGTNNATVTLYQQTNSSSAPTTGANSGKPEGNSTYTFATGSLAFTTANGWSQTNPGVSSTNQYLWVTQATAIGANAATTDVIPDSEWSTIKLFASYGAVGDPGTKTALVYAYKRSGSDLSGINVSSAGPGAVTVSLTTGLITTGSLANSWSKTPVASDGNPLYITAASAAGTGSTDSIAASEWSAPAKLVEDGSDGDSAVLVSIYKEVAFTDARPSISGTSNYNFSTSTLSSIPTGWSTTVPTFNPIKSIWQSEVVVTGSGATNSVTWPTPVNYSPFFDLNPNAFIRATSQPSTPSTGIANPPSGWSSTIPSGTDPVWQTSGTFSYNVSGSTYSWTAPEKITGDTGSAGINSATIMLYKTTTTDSAPAHPDTVLTWNFANKAFTDNSSELDGWSVNTVPASDNTYLWSCSATAAANTATDDIAVSEWTDPAKIGSPKARRSATGEIYYDASTTSAQAAPTTSGVSYNFDTAVFSGLASGWSQARGTPAYTILPYTVTEASHGGTQTVTWGTPRLVGSIFDKDRDDWILDWDDTNNKLRLLIDGTVTSQPSYPDKLLNSEITSSDLAGSGKVWASLPASGANNYSLPSDVLKGTPTISGTTITLPNSGGGNTQLVTQDTVYSLPSTVPTAVSFSGGTLTVTRAAGNQTYTIPDTNTTYANLAALDSTANTKLSGIATGATNNGSTLNSSGNIANDITMGSKMRFDVSEDHLIITD